MGRQEYLSKSVSRNIINPSILFLKTVNSKEYKRFPNHYITSLWNWYSIYTMNTVCYFSVFKDLDEFAQLISKEINLILYITTTLTWSKEPVFSVDPPPPMYDFYSYWKKRAWVRFSILNGKNALTHYLHLVTESDSIEYPHGEKPALVLPLLFLDYNTGMFCLYVYLMHILSY